MKRQKLFIFAINVLSIIVGSQIVLAQETIKTITPDWLKWIWNPSSIAQLMTWARWPDVLYYIIVPSAIGWFVIFGFLETIGIFRGIKFWGQNLHGWIAFFMTVILWPSGVLVAIVNTLYAFGAAIAMIAFGLLFILGAILISITKGRGLWGLWGIKGAEAKYGETVAKEIEDINKQINLLRREQIDAIKNRNVKRQKEITDAIAKLEDQRRGLKQEL